MLGVIIILYLGVIIILYRMIKSKNIVLLLFFWCPVNLSSQVADVETYHFMNSVYLDHVDSISLDYYLYDKPIYITLADEDLLDTLTHLLSSKETQMLVDKILGVDSSIRWEEEHLNNARIIDENSLLNHNVRDCPVYYFSLPIFSSSFDYAIFQVKFDKGFQQATQVFLYRKQKNNWVLFIRHKGIGTFWLEDGM